MYITTAATTTTLRRLARMAPGSIVAMTFMVPLELVDEADRAGLEAAARGARASGTPWISFYTPEQIVTLALEAGFADARYIETAELAEPYLASRGDDVRPSSGEAILIART
jgi:O-methyltransferase involved in polyketide biosynthesis